MFVIHKTDHTPDTVLDVYRQKIIDEIDGLALRVGRVLREAKQEHPDEFDNWVNTQLPFGLETARRLMAISAAYEKLPAETIQQLPRPWQAMYALKELGEPALAQGIASGEINPNMTVKSAVEYARRFRQDRKPLPVKRHISTADDIAGALMRHKPTELNPQVLSALCNWMLASLPPAEEDRRHG